MSIPAKFIANKNIYQASLHPKFRGGISLAMIELDQQGHFILVVQFLSAPWSVYLHRALLSRALAQKHGHDRMKFILFPP